MKFNQFNERLFSSIFITTLFCGLLLANPFDAYAQASAGKIAFVNNVEGTRALFVIDTDGTNRTRLSFNSIAPQNFFDFTADGRLVTFEFFSNIYVMNSNGTAVRQLTFTNNNDEPAISPDGTKVAFSSTRNGNTDIYVVNADGTNTRRVTTHPVREGNPSFSPDGTQLLYESYRSGSFGLPNIYRINIDGTNETRLTNYLEFEARFSPNGTRITYAGRIPPGNNFAEIFVMNADGTNVMQLTNLNSNTLSQAMPSFSLDGTLISFTRRVPNPGGGSSNQIFVMNANGSNVRQVTFFDAANGSSDVAKWVPSNLLATRHEPFDFDGEGRADISVFRPSEGNWFRISSLDNSFNAAKWGLGTDKLAPADYDGDARTDLAVFRDGVWWIFLSSNNQVRNLQFGVAGDLPRPGDFDGDGKADISIFRPSDGTWWRQNSSNGQVGAIQFGLNGDVPMLGDYDGDGTTDFAVFRPSNGVWYVFRSSDNQVKVDAFGLNGDIPLNGDFNGDGKADLAVFRPSDGIWYVAKPTGVPAQNFDATRFGLGTDIPVPTDYDGDGKTDIAIFRSGVWWILRSNGGQVMVTQFGVSSDKPVEAAYSP